MKFGRLFWVKEPRQNSETKLAKGAASVVRTAHEPAFVEEQSRFQC